MLIDEHPLKLYLLCCSKTVLTLQEFQLGSYRLRNYNFLQLDQKSTN